MRAASDLAIETLERLRPALAVTSGDAVVRVQVPTRVAAVLRDQLAGAVRDLEREFAVTIVVQDDARLTQAFVESVHEVAADGE